MEDMAVAVTERFGLGEPTAVRYVARGAMGEVWRVDTTKGAWALKVLFAWADYPEHPFDVGIQQAASRAGVLLPRPLLADGAAVVEVLGRRVRAYEWVQLDPPLDAPVGVQRAEEAGRLLGTIHSLDHPMRDTVVDDWYLTTHPPEHWEHLASQVEARRLEWAPLLDRALPEIMQLASTVTPVDRPLGLCHRDFTRSNVLPARADGRLWVLDWENVGPLPADQELAAAVQDWTTTGGGQADPPSVTAFLAGYRRAGGTASIAGRESFAMLIVTALNFLAVNIDQALSDTEHRDHASRSAKSILHQALPDIVSSIDSLLALESGT